MAVQSTTSQIPVSKPYSLRGPGPWYRRGSKYGAILRMSMANHFAYVAESLLRSIFLVLIIFVFVQLWTVTYSVTGQSRIGNYTLPQMVWYFAFAEAIMLSTPFLRRKVDEDVKTGELAYRLNKPYHYVLYLASDYAGEWLARFVLNLIIGSALCLLLVGPISFTLLGVVMALAVLVLAVALDFMGGASVCLLAFWIEDTAAVVLIYRRLVMLLGGMMIPLDVFPEPISSIARALPFSYMVYGPARLWVSPSVDFLLSMLPGLFISLAAAAAILFALFRKGQRNLAVNGG